MKLPQLFREAEMPDIDFDRFLNPNRPSDMPPLDTRKLVLEALTGQGRSVIKTPYNGTGTLLIRYDSKDGGQLSIDEQEGGDVWDITQVQALKSGKGYRVATCLKWHSLLGKRTGDYARHPESEVRHVIMSPALCMKDAKDNRRMDGLHIGYNEVRCALKMRWSEEFKFFITDIRRGISL